MLTSLLVGWLFVTAPSVPEPGDYWVGYQGQIEGISDTTIEIHIRFYADSAMTIPLSRQFTKWTDVDSKGMFDVGDLPFYHEPTGRKYLYYEVKMLGMHMKGKSFTRRGCGNMEWEG